MMIPDVNILVHAHNSDFSGHAEVKRWWEQALNGEHGEIGLAWAAILGFLRLTTNRTVFVGPLPIHEATRIVRSWLAMDTTRLVAPGPEHADLLFRLLERSGAAGNLTTDAHLAALALEHRATIVSTDADFARFAGLRWFNPRSSLH